LRGLEETAKTLYEETGYSLSLGETVTGLQYHPGGRIGWMVLLKENPEMMKAYLYDARLMKGRGYGEVYEYVRNKLCTFKQEGGHICAGVHNLPPDMPKDHLRAFFKAWQDYREYPA
jgi:hypothetical protein